MQPMVWHLSLKSNGCLVRSVLENLLLQSELEGSNVSVLLVHPGGVKTKNRKRQLHQIITGGNDQQVKQNQESQRLQYALVDRAKAFGFHRGGF